MARLTTKMNVVYIFWICSKNQCGIYKHVVGPADLCRPCLLHGWSNDLIKYYKKSFVYKNKIGFSIHQIAKYLKLLASINFKQVGTRSYLEAINWCSRRWRLNDLNRSIIGLMLLWYGHISVEFGSLHNYDFIILLRFRIPIQRLIAECTQGIAKPVQGPKLLVNAFKIYTQVIRDAIRHMYRLTTECEHHFVSSSAQVFKCELIPSVYSNDDLHL